MTERESNGGPPEPSAGWQPPPYGWQGGSHPEADPPTGRVDPGPTTPFGSSAWSPGPPGSAGPPGWPSQGGWAPPQPPPPKRRGAVWIAIAGLAVVVLVVAIINVSRGHRNTASSGQQPTNQPTNPPTATAPLQPAPSGSAPSGGNSGGSGSLVPHVSCPLIRDEQSHLSYRCIDNYLQQSAPDGNLGLRIALNHEVEPNWVISEGSGNPASLSAPPSAGTVRFQPSMPSMPSGQVAPDAVRPAVTPTLTDVQQEVQRRAALALSLAYGDNPGVKLAGARDRTFSGVTGYQVQLDITINPAWRAANHLKASSEKLWVVGVPTTAGVSIFMLSIPNARSDLWSKADATIGTITVI